jgi:hypothetical protein
MIALLALVQQVAEPFRALQPEDTFFVLPFATRHSTAALPSVAMTAPMLH